MKITKKQLMKIESRKKREAMIAAGAYDGRFRQRIVENKKFKKPRVKPNYLEEYGN